MSHLDQKQSSSPANQALERLIAEHAASGKSVDQRPTAQQTLRVGVINNVNNPNLSAQWLASCDQFLIIQIESTTDLSATKIPSTAEIVTNDSIVRDTFDIVIDLSNDTNKTKAFSLAQAHRSAVENSLFLIHSETKTPTDLLPNVRHSIGITTGEWSGQRFVELIATPETALQVIERACAFSENFADLTLVTRSESQGMLWKIQCSYLVEAMALVGEAADPALIEQCAADAGMREPPLMALDVISLKLMDHILHDELHRLAHAKDHRGHSHDHGTEPDDDHDHDHDHEHAHSHSHDVPSELMPASAVYVLEKMAHGFDRLGVNYGAGFYDYDYDDDPPALWDGLSAFARGNNRVDPADVADRLLFAPAIQFLHCLSDGYSDKLIKANLGAVIGAGFSATAGGPVGFIRKIGLDSFAVRAGELAARYGSRFDLPDHWQTLIQSES